MTETIVVSAERAGLELDEFLCLKYPDYNKGYIRRQVREGMVLVDGNPALPSQRLRPEQVLMVDFDEREAPPPPVAPDVELSILHEEDDWMIVDKPAGLAAEPERWARANATLAGALLELARTRAGRVDGLDVRLRAVHRIDKETSGAVVVAKNLEAERFLRRAFEEGGVRKSYLALVEGEHPQGEDESLVIDLPLGPDARKSGRMVVAERGGKEARTRLSVERRFRGYTLLRCEPLTGRTHQIRVHLAACGFPLAVDRVYGRRDGLFLSELKPGYRPKPGRAERPLIGRLTLHALEVEVPRPAPAEGPVTVSAPLPKDFANTLAQLEKVRCWER